MLAVADHCYCYHHTRDADNAALERDKDRDATRTAVLALTERSSALRCAVPFTPPPSTRNLYNASFKVYHCVLREYANDMITVWNFTITDKHMTPLVRLKTQTYENLQIHLLHLLLYTISKHIVMNCFGL